MIGQGYQNSMLRNIRSNGYYQLKNAKIQPQHSTWRAPGTLMRCLTSHDKHDLHKQTMSHYISHIFSACFVIFSSVIYLTSYRQAKCLIYCLTLNPARSFIVMKNAAIKQFRESVACKRNKTPLYYQLHTHWYVRRFKKSSLERCLNVTPTTTIQLPPGQLSLEGSCCPGVVFLEDSCPEDSCPRG